MSASETTTTYDTQRLRHRRNVVDSLIYDGTEHGRRAIVEWVEAHGGSASSRSTGELLIHTLRGWLPVLPGEHVIHGAAVEGRDREFFPLGADVVAVVYDTNDHGAILDRDQAAAQVLAADRLVEDAQAMVGAGTVFGMLELLGEIVHTLGASHEALR